MSVVNNFFGHLRTITKHRHMVIKHCKKAGILWQGLRHDLSKYSPTEFIPGVKYYTGTKSPNEGERIDKGYSVAWLHHKGRNKHHPEYWLDLDLNDKIYKPVPMPNKYIFESFCDHLAASKVYNKKKFKPQMVWDYYYNKERYYLPIHDKTREKFEFLLKIYLEKGEKETFKYMREALKKEKSKENDV